ncbi:MAG: type II toxin-antitoxin system PemK/MazF family toxin [Symploca sp. SIO2C1]|nr:type II toxin-antitoxin system PemK/MazF family toxin [Symploca sp. SIO2C1]
MYCIASTLIQQTLITAPEGGLVRDSIALAEQVRVLFKERLLQQRGRLSEATLRKLDRALAIALDLERYVL